MYMFNEPMPDCVPEYYRSQQEDEEHEYELQTRRQEIYQVNRQKIAAVASGFPVLDYGGYEACRDCPDADHDTMVDDDDDICRAICRNPACPRHRKEESR